MIRRIEVVWGDEAGVLALDRQARVSPEAGIGRTAVYRLQVAALKDQQQAQGIADYLNAETEYPSESVFDADTDLYRVRVGKFQDRDGAEAARGRLAGLGVTQGWVVSEGGELENAALRLVQGGGKHRIASRWLELRAPDDVGIPFGRTRYRGKLLVFLNERGLLNVINEIPLESVFTRGGSQRNGPRALQRARSIEGPNRGRAYLHGCETSASSRTRAMTSAPHPGAKSMVAWGSSTRSVIGRFRIPKARCCSTKGSRPRPSTAPRPGATRKMWKWSFR